MGSYFSSQSVDPSILASAPTLKQWEDHMNWKLKQSQRNLAKILILEKIEKDKKVINEAIAKVNNGIEIDEKNVTAAREVVDLVQKDSASTTEKLKLVKDTLDRVEGELKVKQEKLRKLNIELNLLNAKYEQTMEEYRIVAADVKATLKKSDEDTKKYREEERAQKELVKTKN